MKIRAKIALLLVCALVLSGCGGDVPPEGETGAAQTGETVPESTVSWVVPQDPFTGNDRQEDYISDSVAAIRLEGDTASCASNAVTISENRVTITDEGTYVLSGSLTDGMIVVNGDKEDKVQIVLDGASIHSRTSAAVYVLQADKVFLTLKNNSENELSNGGSFVAVDENNIDAVVFSKEDLTINGSGSLAIASPAGHGVVSKDDLVIAGGTLRIVAAGHGLAGKDSVRIATATVEITAGKDGIHSENSDDAALGFVYVESGSFVITAEGDGISAAAALQIADGSFTILAGGGSINGEQHSSGNWGGFGGGPGGGPGGRPPGGRSTGGSAAEAESTSMKGIKAGGDMMISGGSFTIDSADDGLHSNQNLTISGGNFSIATGDDGVHGEETLTVSGGGITVTESYEGLEALHIRIAGGEIALTCTDDGLNAAGGMDASGMGGRDQMFGDPGRPGGMGAGNGSIVISGGKITIRASGDGIDANGYLEITGGDTVVMGPTMGDTATLDYDTTAVISGGTFIGTGASGMAQTFSASENQGVIAIQVGSAAAGTQITVTDSQGNELIQYTPELSYNVVILSSPRIQKGESYTITVGTASGTFKAS